MQTEQETCSMVEGLFHNLMNKLWSQYNETIKSPQYCTLNKRNSENEEEKMGMLRITVAECNYKETERPLQEQFILFMA